MASVDKKHQIIIDAQAFGAGQEQHTLQPVIEAIKDKYQRLGLSDNVYKDNIIVTADTGFANEANMKYLYEKNINGYIHDNKFRSRDPKFKDHKINHDGVKNKTRRQCKKIPATEFDFDRLI